MSVELDNVGHKFAASPWLFRRLSARCEDGALTAIIGLRPAHATGQQGQRNVVNGAARADTERILEDPRNAGTL